MALSTPSASTGVSALSMYLNSEESRASSSASQGIFSSNFALGQAAPIAATTDPLPARALSIITKFSTPVIDDPDLAPLPSTPFSPPPTARLIKQESVEPSALARLEPTLAMRGLDCLIFSFLPFGQNGESPFLLVKKSFYASFPRYMQMYESFDFTYWDDRAVTRFLKRIPICPKVTSAAGSFLDQQLPLLVQKCARLQKVIVEKGMEMTDIRPLVALPSLTHLTLSKCTLIKTKMFEELRKCTQLQSFTITHSKEIAPAIKTLPVSLVELGIVACQDETVPEEDEDRNTLHLERLVSLRKFNGVDTHVDLLPIKELLHLNPDVTHVILSSSDIDAEDFSTLFQHLKNMTEIHVDECPYFSNESFKSIPASVVVANIAGCDEISSETLAKTLRNREWKCLILDSCKVDVNCLRALLPKEDVAALHAKSSLKELSLYKCTDLSDAHLFLVTQFTHLEKLNLSHTQVKKNTVLNLKPSLVELDISNCRDLKLEADDYVEIIRKQRNLRLLTITINDLSTSKIDQLNKQFPNLTIQTMRNDTFDETNDYDDEIEVVL